MSILAIIENLQNNTDTFRDATRIRNLGVLTSLLGPALRGFVRQAAKGRPGSELDAANPVYFDWT